MSEEELWYIYTIEYYSAVKKKEILVLYGMDAKRKISQSEKDSYHMISLIYGI